MIRAKNSRVSLVVVGALCLVGVSYRIGKAYASGIPTTNPLVYTGTLMNNGAAVTSAQAIGLKVWATSSPTVSDTPVCSVDPSTIGQTTPDALGRFSIPLPSACLIAVGANPDLWVEVDISALRIGGLTHLGAVPYAVEANHAVSSDNVSDGGALQATIAALQAQLAALSKPLVVFPDGGAAFSAQAIFRGTTTQSYDGLGVGGYTGAKQKCEASLASVTAHMCTSEELFRTASIGLTITTNAWFSNASYAILDSTNAPIVDCGGWTDNLSSTAGLQWGSGTASGSPSHSICSTSSPILCCD